MLTSSVHTPVLRVGAVDSGAVPKTNRAAHPIGPAPSSNNSNALPDGNPVLRACAAKIDRPGSTSAGFTLVGTPAQASGQGGESTRAGFIGRAPRGRRRW